MQQLPSQAHAYWRSGSLCESKDEADGVDTKKPANTLEDQTAKLNIMQAMSQSFRGLYDSKRAEVSDPSSPLRYPCFWPAANEVPFRPDWIPWRILNLKGK